MLEKYLVIPYIHVLKKTIDRKLWRKLAIWAPIAALVLTFVFLAPSIGFKLFPSGDNPFLQYVIE